MANWKTVRVFISSTFRDMFAERDHLVRVVFPELKERCRKKRVHLIDVDLRWGVTEKDAQEGKALDICLDEIDSCRPYFLGLLGHRYGYIPHGHHHSITAQEIYHGVLHNEIPKQVIDLRSIIEGRFEGKRLSNAQINTLVKCYRVEDHKYVLRNDISQEDEGIIRSVFAMYSAYQRDRSFFFFRKEPLSLELAKDKIIDFFDEEEADCVKLAALKQSIINKNLPFFEYESIEQFGGLVRETLWSHIEKEIEQAPEVEKDWLQEERELHELFMADRTRRFVGRRDLLDKMHAAPASNIMVITGEPGCGKSALMARFSEEAVHQHPDWIILPYFVGASPNSTSLRLMLKRFCMQLNRAIGSNEEVPEDIKELTKKFPETLAKAAESKKVLFIIDAVNQLEKTDNAHSMYWLPQELHEHVSFVISTLAGDAHDALMKRRTIPVEEIVHGLEPADVQKLVNDYLKEIRHEFPNTKVEAEFFDKVKAGNPLYILVALEELRVFGKFEELPKRVAALPDNVPALFDQVLQRIENDFNPALVKDMLSYIACGRYGMKAEELQTLLKGHAPIIAAEAEATKLPDMPWARLKRSISAYLFERSGVIDFFHGQLKEAVGNRYLCEETERHKVHKIIADYFETRWQEPYNRALDELPHQRTKAKDIEGIERVLTDLEFIEAKFTAGMAEGLITDYNAIDAGRAMPGPPIVTARLHEGRYGIFCPFCLAKNEIEQSRLGSTVNCPACGSGLKVNPFSVASEWNPAGPGKDLAKGKDTSKFEAPKSLNEFADFVRELAHILKDRPDYTFQQAFYYPDNTSPYKKAAKSVRPLLNWVNKPKSVSSCIQTLEGHTGGVKSCGYSPDGRRIVSASGDKTLKVWDAETGEELFTLKGHEISVDSCGYSPDGRRIVSASGDKTLKVWDAETGHELFPLKGHTGCVNSCAYSPDGRHIVSASGDETLRVWDAETGHELFTLKGHTREVNSCAYSPDGQRIVSALYYDKILKVWDTETGKELLTLKGHTREVNSCAYSPDGQHIVSASAAFDDNPKVWDADTGKELFPLKGFTNGVNSCAYSPDGQRIVSTSYKTLKVWDAETGQELFTLEGHTNSAWTGVNSCVYSPDGRRIVSTSEDKTLKVWDAKTGQGPSPSEGQIESCAYSPDGLRIVSASWNRLKVWNSETGQELFTLKGDTNLLRSCAYSPDGRLIVSTSYDNTLKVWDAETGRALFPLKGHTGGVESCAYSPDSRRIVSTSEDKTLKVWDAKTGQELFTLKDHTAQVNSCAYSPDGSRIVSASGDATASVPHVSALSPRDNTLIVWNASTGEELCTLEGHTSYIKSCAYSPDGRHIVSASGDETLRVWDAETGKELCTLEGHIGGVRYCAYSPDGSRIVSVSWDRPLLKIWDAETGEELSCFYGTYEMRAVACSIEGVTAGDDGGTIYILKLPVGEGKEPYNTPVRLYRFDRTAWDDQLSAKCEWCGKRFEPDNKIIDSIKGLNSNLSPDQSPAASLPPEAWDDPRLFCECPNCHKPLRFNPFIVDNSKTEYRSQ